MILDLPFSNIAQLQLEAYRHTPALETCAGRVDLASLSIMSKLEVTIREEETVAIVSIDGDVDAHTATQFETELERLVRNKEYRIVVNCSELKYISSAGLGVFMAFIEEVRKNEGDIRLSNIPRRARRTMELFEFPTLFQMFEDEKQAIESFHPA